MNNKEKAIGDVIVEFIESASGNSKKTGATYAGALKRFTEYLTTQGIQANAPISTLSVDHARGFKNWLIRRRTKEEQELSLATRRLYHIAIGRFYRSLIVDRRIEADMQDYSNLRDDLKIKLPDEPIDLKLPPEKVIEAILALIDQGPPPPANVSEKERRRLHLIWLRDRAIVLTFLSTGMRVGELAQLRRGDLTNEDQGAWVTGKGNKKRFVRLSNDAWGAMWAYLNERQDGAISGPLDDKPVFVRHSRPSINHRLPISTRLVQRLFVHLIDRTGISDFHFTPHTLRHYVATQFLQRTGNLALTQDLLGHADPATTRIYAKTNRNTLIKEHRRIFDEDK